MQKRTRQFSEWIKALKPGKYTTEDLIKISGKAATTIRDVMNRLEVKKTQEDIEGSNLKRNVYVWTKQLQEKVNKE